MNSKRPSRANLSRDLEHRILQGLACEWEQAALFLPPEARSDFRKPLFAIRTLSKTFGYWSPGKREISLSRHLVLNYAWDTVCEVLRHEMAHQYAHEVLRAGHEKPHGHAFQKACRLLRADPKASARYRKLSDKPGGFEYVEDNDKILLRIQKLMALAESCHRGEAEAAMTKAHELIKKYNIDLIEQNRKRHFISVFVGQPALRHFREAYALAHLLHDFYFVETIWVPAFVLEKIKMGRVLEISGVQRNVEIAHYVYDYVKVFIDTRWREYNQDKGLNRYRKTDFAVGIINGFRKTLAATPSPLSSGQTGSELMIIDDPKLQRYIDRRYPRLRKFSRDAARHDRGVMEDGIDEGKKLIISKGVTEKKEGRTRLIGDKE